MLSGEILKALAEAVAQNEKTQQKFRMAVLVRLAKIETIVQMIHGAVIVLGRKHGNFIYGDEVEKDAKAAGEFISQKSEELGLAMVKYIYDEPELREGGRGFKEAELPDAPPAPGLRDHCQTEQRARQRIIETRHPKGN
jgi:hypothetical protein